MNFGAYAPSVAEAPTTAYHQRVVESVGGSALTGKVAASAGSPPPSPKDLNQCNPGYVVSSVEHFASWSPYLETLFQQLVGLRASQKLDAYGRVRLAKLRHARQRLKNPVAASQFLKDFKANDLRRKALAAVEEYIHFVESPQNRKKA